MRRLRGRVISARMLGFTLIEIAVVITLGLALMAGAVSFYNTALARIEGANYIRDFSSLMTQIRSDHKYGISAQEIQREEYPYSAVSLDVTMSLLNWRQTDALTFLTPSGVPVRFDWASSGGIGAQRIQVTVNVRKSLCSFLLSDPQNLYRSFGGTHNLHNVNIVTAGGATTTVSNITADVFKISGTAHELCENRSYIRMAFDPFNLNWRKLNYE